MSEYFVGQVLPPLAVCKPKLDEPSDQISQWFAVRCTLQHEATASAHLHKAGITAFMPMFVRFGKRHGQLGRCRVYEPLVRGYVFVLIDPTEQQQATVLGVDDVVEFLGCLNALGETKPLTIPMADMLRLQADERNGLFDETRPIKKRYRPIRGDCVAVTAGVWQGYFAKVIATPKGERAHVMMDISKGRGRGVVLPIDHLSARS